MESRELVEVALRVLKAWTSGEHLSSSADIEILRRHALPDEVDLAPDDLACYIVNRECSRVIGESQGERKQAGCAVEPLAPNRYLKTG